MSNTPQQPEGTPGVIAAIPDEGLMDFAKVVLGITTIQDALSLARRCRVLEIIEGAAENFCAERKATCDAGEGLTDNTPEEEVAAILEERGKAEEFALMGLRAALQMSHQLMQVAEEETKGPKLVIPGDGPIVTP